MAEPAPTPDADLYERDFYAWTQDQAAKLRARAHNAIDWENAAEEIETLGRSEKRELESRLGVLLLHLLKWRYQPEGRSNSWRGTINEQRRRIGREIVASPSLAGYPGQILYEEYPDARLKAAGETGLSEETFPLDCPFTIDQILHETFYPETD
ncbi:DUF29 domain-containing protein [Aurantimonas marianensis]|uniref:DUF29 domain-containing protein n=1 Tax=Aurantimonas marianensis TaxID=2920428 RepID=A0A9X2HB09_9HYPH|nr:DUF29 domain-containing protein [Aurantimonas marianensis]MCP3053639.1 DUF29 domain-containing protein [Aurantimonas marianensis]